jgi:kinetochor protein Mis14/NSL1
MASKQRRWTLIWRKRVAEKVHGHSVQKDQWCGSTCLAAIANTLPSPEIEPFDHRLAKRIQDTSSQIESLTLQLANLRRNAPSSAAQTYAASFAKESGDWDRRFRTAEQETIARAEEVDIEVKGLERVDEMSWSWERGTETLVGVKEGITATVASLERARDAVRYLEKR